ncbi:hypothetical protein [Sphingomonas sp. NIBR02145]|uniref:hypothetical protein n=1 Tax=Sphingomonas sp. NIBR02145 TaxID=3014784 RepID=UPI0022B4CB1E|nr:hypothetical protein [Sphingomonas sp. NIBR02145]WHU03230.1 hypothetical protein O3305_01045 [Sphingomonas sp. NIBR02145]
MIDDYRTAMAAAAQLEAAAEELQVLTVRLDKLVRKQEQSGSWFEDDWPDEYRIRGHEVDGPLEAGAKLFKKYLLIYPAQEDSWRDGGSYWGENEKTNRPLLEQCADKARILRLCAAAVRGWAGALPSSPSE